MLKEMRSCKGCSARDEKDKDEPWTYLVRGIAYTNIKVGQIGLDNVSEQNL